jgi:glycosyltransferase involved in cell wall biosynthesis
MTTEEQNGRGSIVGMSRPVGPGQRLAANSLPVVVQHSAGESGASGPMANLERVLASPLAARYHFVRMHQATGNGGINFSLLRDWVRLLRDVKPDLVHVRGLQNEGFHGVLAARLAGCARILVSVHGTVRDILFARRSYRRLVLEHIAEPATLRAATHVATVCDHAAHRTFLKPFSAKFVGVVPNGVPAASWTSSDRERMRREHGLGNGDIVIATVSRLTWEKGYAVLADALRWLPPPPSRLVLLIIGDGPDRPEIERAFSTNRTIDVRFLGRRLDVGYFLRGADLFVFPTLHENLSNALLEAMAHGLPVIASAVGGNVEVLTRGGGLLVPSDDPMALTCAMARLCADADLRSGLGDRARQVVSTYYSLNVMLSTLDGVYQRILSDLKR